MANAILIEEFHVTVYVPQGLREDEYDAVRQALDEPRFRAGLKRAARAVVRRYPALSKVTIRLSR